MRDVKGLQDPPFHERTHTALAKDVVVIGEMCRRVSRRLSRRKRDLELPKELIHILAGTRQSMDALLGMMKERLDD